MPGWVPVAVGPGLGLDFGHSGSGSLLETVAGLANCRYVAHQIDRKGQNAPKGYIARQEMTPEIANIHVGRVHNEMVLSMNAKWSKSS